MERTIGFDFGTHQTKICVEEKEGANIGYHFFQFKDLEGKINYLLPSIVRINPDQTLSYGYVDNGPGEIVRYFKQATYCTSEFKWSNKIRADYFSIWYIAYILFYVEQAYETNFATNMGVPTDTASLDKNKVRAVTIMLSAIRLVEDVFHNDLAAFLKCTMTELFEKTEIVQCSKKLKEEYSILVFPEAYACLRPLTARKKIATGMSLMVDIGGGTTDVSFFTIEHGNAQIYKFISIAKGLNFLTGVDGDGDIKVNPSSITNSSIDNSRQSQYTKALSSRIRGLLDNLESEFRHACSLDIERLNNALKNRPIIFAGGGSTFQSLCQAYFSFSAVRRVSVTDWNITCFPEFEKMGLCPILNTAYGLSISESATHDEIAITPFNTIFDNLKDDPNSERAKALVTVDPRDGTEIFGVGSEYTNKETDIAWRLFRFVSSRRMIERPLSAHDISFPDTITRVRSSEIKFPSTVVKKTDTTSTIKSNVHKLEHDQQDVDDYLMLNYEHHIPITDRLRDLYAANIPDAGVRENFLLRVAELNIECELYEEQQKKDREAREYLNKIKTQPLKFFNMASIPPEKEHKSTTIYKGKESNLSVEKDKKPSELITLPIKKTEINVDFKKGDRVGFLDSVGFGVVVRLVESNRYVEVETDEGFIINMPISKCVKTNTEDQYFQQSRQQSTQPVAPKPQIIEKKESISKEEKQMQVGLAALMEKYNRKK